jgi:hypothetical protein
MMQLLARLLGLRRRLIIPVPFFTPKLSSLWIHLITPLSSAIARPLAEGLRNRVVVQRDDAQRLMPHRCRTIEEAMASAVQRVESGTVETAWTDAGPIAGDPEWAGGAVLEDRRERVTTRPPAAVWAAVSAIGGDRGYYAADWLWWLRGVLDRLIGGPGLRRGRRNPTELHLGDVVDFWRVSALEPGRRLELTAEMLVPGTAILRFELTPEGAQGTRVTQTARFRPRGLLGLAYWYAIAPLHAYVFPGMLGGLVRAAERGRA